MKRMLLLVLICILAFTSISVGAATTMYAPDGRTMQVNDNEVATWEKVGWFTYPTVMLYAPDGRKTAVAPQDVKKWTNVGWYEEPMLYVYAPDGRKTVIEPNDFLNWYKVGWSLAPGHRLTGKSLASLEPIDTNYVRFDDMEIMLCSQQLKNCIVPQNGDQIYFSEDFGVYATYFLNGKYKFFGGTLSPLFSTALKRSGSFDRRMEEIKLEFYLDNKKVSETDYVKINDYKTVDFSLDVRGANFLEIHFVPKTLPGNYACTYLDKFAAGDMWLYK